MGIDIRAFIECYDRTEREYKLFVEVYFIRNKGFFGYLSNNSHTGICTQVPNCNRGLPVDVSSDIKDEYDILSEDIINPSWISISEACDINRMISEEKIGTVYHLNKMYMSLVVNLMEELKLIYKSNTRMVYWFFE